MLTALIALTTTFGALQDAPAPAPEPAVAAPVGQTSEKVMKYLKEAEANLYDPQAAGLTSLEFDLPVEVPMMGQLGQVHVTWTKGGQTTMDVTETEGVMLPPNLPPGAVEQMAQQSAAEVVNAMLNRPISMLLDGGTATLAGAEEGMVKVDFDAPEAREAGVKSQSYYFDDDGILRKSVTVAEAPGMMGGTMTVTANQAYTWKAIGGEGSLLVPDVQSVEADLGIMVQKVKIAYTYTTIDGVVIANGIEKTIELPEMMGGTQTQKVAVANLVVNGKREGAPAAEPAAPSGG